MEDKNLLMERYHKLRETMKDIPEYWKSKEMFSIFDGVYISEKGKTLILNEQFLDDLNLINKNLTRIENRVEKELRGICRAAVTSTGVTANGNEQYL